MAKFPVALALAVADKVLEYVNRQTLDRPPTTEEIQLAGDARRLQAAAAQADADDAGGAL